MKNVAQICKNVLSAGVALAVVSLASPGFAQTKPEKAKSYPLKTCVVSGEKLGEMGKPYVFTNGGWEVKLCCKGCLADFNKEPAKYIKKLEETKKAAGAKTQEHSEHQH